MRFIYIIFNFNFQNMELISPYKEQIKLYEGLISTYTEYLKSLRQLDLRETNSESGLESEPDIFNDEQDMIWDRMHKAHMLEPTIHIEPNIHIEQPHQKTQQQQQHSQKPNNIDLPEDLNINLLVEKKVGADQQAGPEKKAGTEKKADQKREIITRLSRFTKEKQNEIIKRIFAAAKENMERLALLDKNILNTTESIYKEADRILEVYLNEGGPYEN